MPNSLTMNLSSALVYSTRPPVSVCGTGLGRLELRRFSRESDYRRCHFARGLRVLSGLGKSGGFACRSHGLPPFNAPFRRRAGVSLLRHSVAVRGCDGMFTVSSIGVASRLSLRTRLTLIRLALIRKPWSYGEGVSRPLCRYLYLHLLFRSLHTGSALCFRGAGMLPYRWRNSAIPRLRHRTSCPIIIHARPLDR